MSLMCGRANVEIAGEKDDDMAVEERRITMDVYIISNVVGRDGMVFMVV